ncbi:MAG: TldE/PmbA family protein [Desulfobacteraceae bacterium]|nr:TldE/PmbA family protein [Desulfobacteraceae bacterium]
MRDYFYKLADHAFQLADADDILLLNIRGELSDFVRMNNARIRQGGKVEQSYLEITLINGRKRISHSFSLLQSLDIDKTQVASAVENLHAKVSLLPEDAYLSYSRHIHSTEDIGKNELPDTQAAMDRILHSAEGNDLVGIYAAGLIYRGFANNLGQKNWYESHSFNFDFSLYHHQDKAVKSGYTGFTWDQNLFQGKMDQARAQLEIMKRDPLTISPGAYRVYLAPKAMGDLVDVLNRRAFGARDRHNKTSSLNRMIYEGKRLNPGVTILENTGGGSACRFQSDGFIKPDEITLVQDGTIKDPLVGSRSAVELNMECNGASAEETADSLEILPGKLRTKDIIPTLDTGLYLNNLHYINFSDVNSARLTGLTRFAAFHIKNGEIEAPINVMRFDETMYNVLGENLEALTAEQELLVSSNTQLCRHTECQNIPGAIVNDFRFTL